MNSRNISKVLLLYIIIVLKFYTIKAILFDNIKSEYLEVTDSSGISE